MKPLALGEAPDRAGRHAARAVHRNGGEMRADRLHVERRVERGEPCRIEVYPGLQKAMRRTRHDHADVEELLALDPQLATRITA